MKTYKKHFLTILCAMTTTHLFANGYKGEAPPQIPVTIPSFKGGVELGITALYVRPSSENLNYFDVSRIAADNPLTSTAQTYNITINPNDNWGFIFDIGYVFPNTANDVRLDWMSFHSSYDSDFFLIGSNTITTQIFFYPVDNLFIPNDNSGATALATMNYKLDAVDLTVGQYLNFYKRLQTRLFTGLRYTRIDSDLTTAYSTISIENLNSSSEAITGELNSSFNGLGPMIGIRADFALGKGFGLSGTLDGALLVGQLGLNGNEVIHQITDGDLSNSHNYLNWDGLATIAPAYDAKFGLNYRYLFSNGTLLGVELGYQVTKYYNVIEKIDRDTTSIPYRYDTDIIHFDLQGGYLTLQIKV